MSRLLARIESYVLERRARGSALADDPDLRGLIAGIDKKIAATRRLIREREAASLDEWRLSPSELSRLVDDILVDVGCLRVARRGRDVATAAG